MTLVRSSLLFTGAQVVLLVLGLANAIVISRLLGPSGRGIVSLAGVLVGLITALGTFGFAAAFAYFAGKRRYAPPQLVGATFLSAALLGGGSAFIVLALADPLLATLLAGMTWLELAATAVSIPFAFLTLFLMTYLIGAGQAVRAARLQIGAAIVAMTLLVVALGPLQGDVAGGILAISATSVLVALATLALVARDHGFSLRGTRPILAAAGRYGIQVYPGTLSGQFWLRADVFVLNAMSGAAAVGQYTLATSLAEKVWVLDSSVAQVTMHEVIGSSGDASARLVARTTRNILFVAGLGCVALAVVAPWAVPLLFGDAFREAVMPLWLLLPGVLAIATARPMSTFFSGHLGRPLITSGVSVATAVVAVVAYLALIPPYGASGAAAGSSLAYLVPLVVYLPLFRRLTGISLRDQLLVTRDDAAAYARLARGALRRRPVAT